MQGQSSDSAQVEEGRSLLKNRFLHMGVGKDSAEVLRKIRSGCDLLLKLGPNSSTGIHAGKTTNWSGSAQELTESEKTHLAERREEMEERLQKREAAQEAALQEIRKKMALDEENSAESAGSTGDGVEKKTVSDRKKVVLSLSEATVQETSVGGDD